jgi:chemotaxis protein methyltransferase CheR
MSDAECVSFLQWALPRMNLRWAGFRKVRRQVCKRVKRRIDELGFHGLAEYRAHLEQSPEEWRRLDEFCRITISRFYRDRGVFEILHERVLPELAEKAETEGRSMVRVWSAGCASGEEVYTLKILWDLTMAARFPACQLSVIATDVDKTMLSRADTACYEASSLRELPQALIADAFERKDGLYCVRACHKSGVTLLEQDLRREAPEGPFDLVLCRYVAFTYFAPELQKVALARIASALGANAILVIGAHETLPEDGARFEAYDGSHQIFRRRC